MQWGTRNGPQGCFWRRRQDHTHDAFMQSQHLLGPPLDLGRVFFVDPENSIPRWRG